MKILTTSGNLRECFRLSTWFINEPTPHLLLRVHRWLEVLQGEQWQRLPNTAPAEDLMLGLDRFVDPATLRFVEPADPGAVSLMGFVATADAAALGLTSLTGQSVFSAIAELLESIVLVNGLIQGAIPEQTETTPA